MRILSYNPGHDGAIALLADGRLIISAEAEKDSNYRYSPISSHDVWEFLGDLDEAPDVFCNGGWWPRDHFEHSKFVKTFAGYRGVDATEIQVNQTRFFGKTISSFSSSHERSHILCAFGMSDLPKGEPCYALVWEGAIGSFYEIDEDFKITLIKNVLNQPGNRYALLYGLADPTFPKDAPFSRFSDAGKLMALASFSRRLKPNAEEQLLLENLLNEPFLSANPYASLQNSRYYNVGLDDPEFRDFAGIYSDRIFDIFHRFAEQNLSKRLPLIISGGCGLNCDWNSKWQNSGLFDSVFVPPVANDSGAAIGTAIDAQLHFTKNPKIEWSVYSGRNFVLDQIDLDHYDVLDARPEKVAGLLAAGLILGWINGKYEIGPRALGNRSILASPFQESTRDRLNNIKQRESFRPIAPMCLMEDAKQWFGCEIESPYMLFTYKAKTEELKAVTHVNGTARIQTVTKDSNRNLYALLENFKQLTGYGVLCNTSLNFNGRGFINRLSDLSAYTLAHNLDGFVAADKIYLVKKSAKYMEYSSRA